MDRASDAGAWLRSRARHRGERAISPCSSRMCVQPPSSSTTLLPSGSTTSATTVTTRGSSWPAKFYTAERHHQRAGRAVRDAAARKSTRCRRRFWRRQYQRGTKTGLRLRRPRILRRIQQPAPNIRVLSRFVRSGNAIEAGEVHPHPAASGSGERFTALAMKGKRGSRRSRASEGVSCRRRSTRRCRRPMRPGAVVGFPDSGAAAPSSAPISTAAPHHVR